MKLFIASLLIAGVLGGPVREPTDNIVELATKLGATTLVDLVVRAGLDGALSGPGPLTVVGPTNEAFAALPQEVLDMLMNNNTALQEVLKFHVHAGRLTGEDIQNDQLVSTLQGTPARNNIYGEDADGNRIVTVTGSRVILGDQLATNGVIQVLNKVMYPIPSGTVVDAAVGNPAFSTLVTALQRAELVDVLAGPGPFTVLAPTNDAFAKIPSDELDRILNDKDLLTSILLFHVVGSTAYSAGVSDGTILPSLEGNALTFAVSEDGISVNGANVVIADLSVTNGVIHAIDTVLIPPAAPTDNIVELATKLGATTLVDLVVRAGLDGALSGPGPLTVVGPTNEAFAALPQEVLDMLMNNNTALQEVLKYHVHAGRLTGADIQNDQLVSTLQGTPARNNIYGEDADGNRIVTVTGSRVILGDQLATNGVIQVLNKVMYPIPSGTVVDAAVGNPAFSTLVTALQRAELVDVLNGPGPFTVFAPTNDAFAKIPSDELDRILNDKDLLTAILLYHVTVSTNYKAGVSDGAELITLLGSSIRFGVSGDDVTVNGANVVIGDLSVTNGVIHAIDTVLIPSSY